MKAFQVAVLGVLSISAVAVALPSAARASEPSSADKACGFFKELKEAVVTESTARSVVALGVWNGIAIGGTWKIANQIESAAERKAFWYDMFSSPITKGRPPAVVETMVDEVLAKAIFKATFLRFAGFGLALVPDLLWASDAAAATLSDYYEKNPGAMLTAFEAPQACQAFKAHPNVTNSFLKLAEKAKAEAKSAAEKFMASQESLEGLARIVDALINPAANLEAAKVASDGSSKLVVSTSASSAEVPSVGLGKLPAF